MESPTSRGSVPSLAGATARVVASDERPTTGARRGGNGPEIDHGRRFKEPALASDVELSSPFEREASAHERAARFDADPTIARARFEPDPTATRVRVEREPSATSATIETSATRVPVEPTATRVRFEPELSATTLRFERTATRVRFEPEPSASSVRFEPDAATSPFDHDDALATLPFERESGRGATLPFERESFRAATQQDSVAGSIDVISKPFERIPAVEAAQAIVSRTLARISAIHDAPASFAAGSNITSLASLEDTDRRLRDLVAQIGAEQDADSARGVLEHGLAQLTDSTNARVLCFDARTGVAFVPGHDPQARALDPNVQALVAQVARSGQRVFLGRIAVEPIGIAPSPGVLVLHRPPASPPYNAHELAIVGTVARRVEHLVQALATTYAPPAPAPVVVQPATLSPRLRRGIIALVGIAVAALIAIAFVRVPTYVTGTATINVEGTQIVSPADGVVAEVLVTRGQHVEVGDPLVRLVAPADRDAIELFLGRDGARRRAQASLDASLLRAPISGEIGDVDAKSRARLDAGAPLAEIKPDRAVPSITATFATRAPIEAGMTLRLAIAHERATAIVDSVERSGDTATVRAHFTSPPPVARDGSTATAELELGSTSLLRSLTR